MPNIQDIFVERKTSSNTWEQVPRTQNPLTFTIKKDDEIRVSATGNVSTAGIAAALWDLNTPSPKRATGYPPNVLEAKVLGPITSDGTFTLSLTLTDSTGSASRTARLVVRPQAPPATAPDSPASVSAIASSASQVYVRWNLPSNDGGSPITGYQIERATGSGNYAIITSGNFPTLSYSDTGLTGNTTYHYRVSAFNAIGTSPPSTDVSVTTMQAPPPTSNIVITSVYPTAFGPETDEFFINGRNFPNNLSIQDVKIGDVKISSVRLEIDNNRQYLRVTRDATFGSAPGAKDVEVKDQKLANATVSYHMNINVANNGQLNEGQRLQITGSWLPNTQGRIAFEVINGESEMKQQSSSSYRPWTQSEIYEANWESAERLPDIPGKIEIFSIEDDSLEIRGRTYGTVTIVANLMIDVTEDSFQYETQVSSEEIILTIEPDSSANGRDVLIRCIQPSVISPNNNDGNYVYIIGKNLDLLRSRDFGAGIEHQPKPQVALTNISETAPIELTKTDIEDDDALDGRILECQHEFHRADNSDFAVPNNRKILKTNRPVLKILNKPSDEFLNAFNIPPVSDTTPYTLPFNNVYSIFKTILREPNLSDSII